MTIHSSIENTDNGGGGGGEYQLLLETADILYSYSDTRELSRFASLSAANAAALPWLLRTLAKENLPAPPEDEIVETTLPGGELMLSCSSGDDLDFTVEVKFVPATPAQGRERVYTAFKQDCGETQVLGVFRQEEKANARAEMELRREAQIGTWKDRRRWKVGQYREEYDLERGFEGEWRPASAAEGRVVRVWVQGAELE